MIQATLFISFLLISYVSGLSSSYEECLEVASRFANTCGTLTTAQTGWTFTGETKSCSGQSTCPDSASAVNGVCTWTRRLCVTCSQTDSVTYIRVQSNGLPDHCYTTPQTVKTQTVDWKVKFNAEIGRTVSSVASQSAFDTKLCTPQAVSDSNLPSEVGFTQNINNQATVIVGITLNGVVILNGQSAENTDPFYPKTWSGAGTIMTENVDACTAHPQGTQGIYHYHMLPPCVVNKDNIQTTKPCVQVSLCNSDKKAYALESYTSQANFLKIIGIAKDGHLIYGPYESANTLFDCNTLDMCNGKYVNGSYGYVWTNTWPYSVACWGPGQNTSGTYTGSCSTNTCPASVSNGGGSDGGSNGGSDGGSNGGDNSTNTTNTTDGNNTNNSTNTTDGGSGSGSGSNDTNTDNGSGSGNGNTPGGTSGGSDGGSSGGSGNNNGGNGTDTVKSGKKLEIFGLTIMTTFCMAMIFAF